jgi:SAM-dependent methyltransferase
MKKLKFTELKEDDLLRIDLGTGKGMNKPTGFIGVDIVKNAAVDKVVDLRKKWPWKTGTVDELNANYLIQYFRPDDRIHFVNEAYRVLKVGGKLSVTVPHWCASKAWGDIASFYPPVAESWFMLLNKAYRDSLNFIPIQYQCNFDFTLGYSLHPQIQSRNQEYIQDAITWKKEAAQDICATLTKI